MCLPIRLILYFIICVLSITCSHCLADRSVAPRLVPIEKTTGEENPDFLENFERLFLTNRESWEVVAEQIDQFKFYATSISWLSKRNPELFHRTMQSLEQLNLGVEVEIGIRKGLGHVRDNIADPIIKSGGRLDRVTIDNTFVKAHYRFRDDYKWSYGETVQHYADFVRDFKTAYPQTEVAMIEAVFAHFWEDAEKFPARQKGKITRMDLKQILSDVQKACIERGVRLDAFVAEYSFSRIEETPAGWATLEAIEKYCDQLGIQFGILYSDHSGGFTSDKLFAKNVVAMAEAFNKRGLSPEIETVQSWFAYPEHILPENEPDSFMGVAKSVFDVVLHRK